MAFYDLTHPLSNLTPVYPGSRPPRFTAIAGLEKEKYREKWLEMAGHTGTHIDAPAHMLENGMTLDRYPAGHFTGKAAIIRIPSGTSVIGLEMLKPGEAHIAGADWLLLCAGWSRYWGSEEYFRGYPVLSEEAAVWITGKGLKGIGLDMISVDPVESADWPVHHILFRAGMVIVENLVFPEDCKTDTVEFYCFPLKIAEADGSPVRAVIRI